MHTNEPNAVVVRFGVGQCASQHLAECAVEKLSYTAQVVVVVVVLLVVVSLAPIDRVLD